MIRKTSLTLLTLGAVACGHESSEHAAPTETTAGTVTVAAEQLTTVMPVEGTVHAANRAALSTRMMARVSAIPVEVGDKVRAGQTLIRLGTEDIAVNRAKAEAALRAARAARDEAVRQSARMDTLYSMDVVPLVQRDAARLGLTQAESQLALAEATLSEVEAADRYAAIQAPFDGAIAARNINEGDLAAPGMPLMTIEATGAREAVVSVPADVAAHVEVGSLLTVSTGSGLSTGAPVTAVASGADPMTRTVQVRASLPADWPTGVAVTALVPAGTRMGIAIPQRAVVRRGQLTGVRVVTEQGELIRWVRLGRTVATATTGDDTEEPRVEVLSGLQPGERIVP
ncbi:MAG: efflux RND transporter periplasmic adaptor subunit [Gemmatimonadota bacterium]|nr:MAG: efflux RND transporter periplasmic adaptor subunit [Gemmatimonadota bacterium]